MSISDEVIERLPLGACRRNTIFSTENEMTPEILETSTKHLLDWCHRFGVKPINFTYDYGSIDMVGGVWVGVEGEQI